MFAGLQGSHELQLPDSWVNSHGMQHRIFDYDPNQGSLRDISRQEIQSSFSPCALLALEYARSGWTVK